jgi:chemotaxis protein methyltransferase CheR
MPDTEYVQFLQTYLPRLGLRWQGFRKVRKQVTKRLKRRLRELQLEDLSAYVAHLESHPEEWMTLDGLCRITISRFYRDRDVFEALRQNVLPHLAQVARADTSHELRCWSAGCASGEEVYTLKMVWRLGLGSQFPEVDFRIIGTDADKHMLERARRGGYTRGSLQELSPHGIALGFDRFDDCYVVRQAFRDGICFVEQDIRKELPEGPFHLVMCRNLVFTYFAEPLQREVLERMAGRLVPGGILLVGKHESLPQHARHFVAYDEQPGMFQMSPFHQPDLHAGAVVTSAFFRGHSHEG